MRAVQVCVGTAVDESRVESRQSARQMTRADSEEMAWEQRLDARDMAGDLLCDVLSDVWSDVSCVAAGEIPFEISCETGRDAPFEASFETACEALFEDPYEAACEALFEAPYEAPYEAPCVIACKAVFEAPHRIALEIPFNVPCVTARKFPLTARCETSCETGFEAPDETEYEAPFEESYKAPRKVPFDAPWITACKAAYETARQIPCELPTEANCNADRRTRPRIRDLLCIGMLAASSAFAAAPEFAAVTPDHAIALPQDSGAHSAFRTEWWYATGWLNTPDKGPLGFQITFFRSATGHDAANPSAFAPAQLIIAHAALSDPAFGHLAHDQRIAREGFGLAYARSVNTDIKLEAWNMVRAPDGHYDVSVDANGFSLHLKLTPTQTPLIQGDRGYSRKGPRPEQASYYYSEPQLRVTGSVVRPGAAGGPLRGETSVTGMAWLDHEWSSSLLDANAVGWDWLGANLTDGSALMAFKVRSRDGHAVWTHAAFRKPGGDVTTFSADQVDFTPLRTWRSPRTNASYPVSMRVKTGRLTWQLDPLMDDQELDSRQSTGAVYWEGAVRVSRDGADVGRGYLELTGYADALRMGGR